MRDSRLILAETLFNELVQTPFGERLVLLDARCAGDIGLRSLVEQLLKNDDSGMGSFMRVPLLSSPRLQPVIPGRIGPYEIIREIGRGGAGVVYEALQDQPARTVALKVLDPGFASDETLRRFEHEAEILATLQDPGIAQVFESGVAEIPGFLGAPALTPWFAMEYVDGEPITSFCDRGRLTIPQRLVLFAKVCRAVQHAHTNGVIHRDLKPSNILAGARADEAYCKIIDFGIAKLTQPRRADVTRTHGGQWMGTPAYMSPEQASGTRDIDTRSDVYALGVLLYELLTGQAPFDSRLLREAEFGEIQRIIREVEPPAPSARVGSLKRAKSDELTRISGRRDTTPYRLGTILRGELDWITLRAMEKDRTRRYDSPRSLATDVERYASRQAVEAAPPSAAYRLRKLVRRHRGVALAAAAVSVALALGVLGVALEAHRADREATQARAVNEFMREVLTSAEPQKRGADVRLIDVLAGASASASSRFAGHPLQEAEVRDLLGSVYFRLSSWPEARAELSKSLELWRSNSGPDDPHALDAELAYASATIKAQENQEAEQVLADLVPRLERVFGGDDPKTLDARRLAAVVHYLRGRLDQAEAILTELHSHPRLLNDDGMQVRILGSLLDLHYRRAGAADLTRPAPDLTQRESLARELIERSTRHSGPDSVSTLEGQVSLARILLARGDLPPVIECCRAILKNTNQRLSPCHSVRTEAAHLLAMALGHTDDARETADLLLWRIDCLRRSTPRSAALLTSSMTQALAFVDRAGRAADGEALVRELKERLAPWTSGHDHSGMMFEPDLYMARFVSMQGRLDEAEPLFQSLLEHQERIPSANLRARLHLFYAGHLMHHRRFEDAEMQLKIAVEQVSDIRMGTFEGPSDDLIRGFVVLYDAWGKRGQADAYRQLLEMPHGLGSQHADR